MGGNRTEAEVGKGRGWSYLREPHHPITGKRQLVSLIGSITNYGLLHKMRTAGIAGLGAGGREWWWEAEVRAGAVTEKVTANRRYRKRLWEMDA